jgi:hypothetical protein
MAMWNCLAHGMANVGPLFEIDGWAIQYCMSRKNSRMSLMEPEIAPRWNPTAWSRRDRHQHEPRGKRNILLLRRGMNRVERIAPVYFRTWLRRRLCKVGDFVIVGTVKSKKEKCRDREDVFPLIHPVGRLDVRGRRISSARNSVHRNQPNLG